MCLARVELRARLDDPGLVILADAFYPGWTLEIDGKPAPIYRANRAMRAAAVAAGIHSLVYRYKPASFRIGLAVSGAGLIVLLALFVRWRISDVSPDWACLPQLIHAVIGDGRTQEAQ